MPAGFARISGLSLNVEWQAALRVPGRALRAHPGGPRCQHFVECDFSGTSVFDTSACGMSVVSILPASLGQRSALATPQWELLVLCLPPGGRFLYITCNATAACTRTAEAACTIVTESGPARGSAQLQHRCIVLHDSER